MVGRKIGERGWDHADVDGITATGDDALDQRPGNGGAGQAAISAYYHRTVASGERLGADRTADRFNHAFSQ